MVKKLFCKSVIEIVPTTPFHFDSTFFKPCHYPSADTKFETGKRWQTMLWQNQTLGLIYQNAGTSSKPKVQISVFSEKKLDNQFLGDLKSEIIWRFNLDLQLADFYRDVGNDSVIKSAIKQLYGLRPMHYGSLYEYLIISITLQNATVRRSVYMLQSLLENYGTAVKFDNQLFYCFWPPKILTKTTEEKLRALKIGYRAKSFLKTSIAFASHEIEELSLRKKAIEEQEKTLLSLYGIGPASVGYIMFDVFHHWDYLKHIAPWEQKIYTKIFLHKDYETSLVPTKEMFIYFEKWDKWKGLATHYVWEHLWWQHRQKPIPWLQKLIRL